MPRTPPAEARSASSPRRRAKESEAKPRETTPSERGNSASVDDIAEELYSLPPEDFIRRRDAFAREAKARGDHDTSASIGRLRKPSTAAWLANQLVRAHPDEIRALLDLGAELRSAQEKLEGDQLRQLSRNRRRVVNGLVHQARQLAVELGKPVGDDVGRELEQSLEAALSSSESAVQLGRRRLTTALTPGASFGSAAPFGSASERLRPVPEVKTKERQPGRRDAAVAERLARATAAAKDAARTLAEQASAHDALVAKGDSLQEKISELAAQLERLETQRAETKRREQDSRRAVAQAERAARNADLVLEAARAEAGERRQGS